VTKKAILEMMLDTLCSWASCRMGRICEKEHEEKLKTLAAEYTAQNG